MAKGFAFGLPRRFEEQQLPSSQVSTKNHGAQQRANRGRDEAYTNVIPQTTVSYAMIPIPAGEF